MNPANLTNLSHEKALHTLINLGIDEAQKGNLEVAITYFAQAANAHPNAPEAVNNLGQALHRSGDFSQAEACLRKALQDFPNNNEIKLSLGTLLLQLGNFAEGFPLFEARFLANETLKNSRPNFPCSEWRGENLNNKALLIYAEQGFGDSLQFVRYLAVLRKTYPKAQLFFASRPALFSLFADFAAQNRVNLQTMSMAGGLPPLDFHIPLMSIPCYLQTTLASIPANVPYLCAAPDLLTKWETKLNAAIPTQNFRIGIVWAGSGGHVLDKARSLHLTQLKSVLETPNVQFISLQKGEAALQITTQIAAQKVNIIHLMDEITDFSETAALITQLDLVISVDTSVLHLAGALGKEVWLMDRFDADWRWLKDKQNSPWYPSMRIFRQPKLGDWQSVMDAVKNALEARLQARLQEISPTAFNRQTSAKTPYLLGSSRLNYQLVEARHGKILANPNDIWIGRALIDYGEYAENEAQFLAQCFLAKCADNKGTKQEGAIVEVGANNGAHSVFLAKCAAAKNARLICLEPQSVLLQNLCANLALNGLTNVETHLVACAEQRQKMVFAEPNYALPGDFGAVFMSMNKVENQQTSASTQNWREVSAISLDELLGKTKVALLKIKIDGALLGILRGAKELIKRDCPILYLKNEVPENSPALIEFLWQKKYRVYWHFPTLFNANNFLENHYNRFGSAVSCNMLCVPEGVLTPKGDLFLVENAAAHPLKP